MRDWPTEVRGEGLGWPAMLVNRNQDLANIEVRGFGRQSLSDSRERFSQWKYSTGGFGIGASWLKVRG